MSRRRRRGHRHRRQLGAEADLPYLSPEPTGMWWRRPLSRLFQDPVGRQTEFLRVFSLGPFDASPLRAPIEPGEGFALYDNGHHRRSRWRGSEIAVPVYFEVREDGDAILICYWLFFPRSTRPVDIQVPRKRKEPDTARVSHFRPEVEPLDLAKTVVTKLVHQGDWEGITVRVAADAVAYNYRAHRAKTQSIRSDEVTTRPGPQRERHARSRVLREGVARLLSDAWATWGRQCRR